MQLFSKAPVYLLLLLFILFSAQCRQGQKDTTDKNNPDSYKESLIKANQEAVREESDQIDDFVRRHKWDIKTTSTGLRYMIYRQGTGAKTEAGRTVKLDYTVTFLTGDTVYTAKKDGPLVFVVGKGQVITGMEEAILMLRVGDHAKFIIPSHLAYGLIGDQNKILHKASLVYDLEFISMF